MKLRRIATISLIVSCMLAVGCSRNPISGRKQLIVITTQQEVALGVDAAPQFEKEFGGLVPDEQLQSYVRRVGQSVADKAHRQDVTYEFALLASDIPNAFALPGGKTYVTAGLMQLMDNERQLAAVLGHEITHVTARHTVEHLQNQIGAAVLVELAGYAAGEDKAQTAQAATEIVTNMVNLSYSRRDEYEADRGGIQYLAAAGYNPWGMVELLEKLMSLHEKEPGRLGEMFQTHPLTSKRIEEAREFIEDDYSSARRGAADPNAANFLKMRSRLREYIKPQQAR